MQKKTIFIAIGLITAITLFFYFDLNSLLTFSYLTSQKDTLVQYYKENRLTMIGLYFASYVLITSLSLPGAAVMTLAGGAIFGLVLGTIIVSFASTLGACFAFLFSRFLIRESIQSRFADKLKSINKGLEKEGAYYLFTLRLIPAFPFFVVNLIMGLTHVKTKTFFWVSQLGMLPGTAVYVNAGTELGKLDSVSGILSPSLILSFVILGLFPIVVKKVIAIVSYKRQHLKIDKGIV